MAAEKGREREGETKTEITIGKLKWKKMGR